MVNEKRLSEKVVSAFAMGTFMASLYYSLVNSYYNFYVTDIAMVPTDVPVSYTHLDVYKRQPRGTASSPRESD